MQRLQRVRGHTVTLDVIVMHFLTAFRVFVGENNKRS